MSLTGANILSEGSPRMFMLESTSGKPLLCMARGLSTSELKCSGEPSRGSHSSTFENAEEDLVYSKKRPSKTMLG